jgi:hypothetical protein
MTFIRPMLCSRLERLERLSERRYIAEPKLDGQRAQIHISKGRTVAGRHARHRYTHPRDEKLIQIRQAIRIRRNELLSLHAGARVEPICWGVMPSGVLRHPLFVRWLA